MSEVSVVIPAYNPGSYLQSTLDSLAAQTFTAWEAVIVDDGSTEDLSWVDDYDARVRRQRQENAGLSAAPTQASRLQAHLSSPFSTPTTCG